MACSHGPGPPCTLGLLLVDARPGEETDLWGQTEARVRQLCTLFPEVILALPSLQHPVLGRGRLPDVPLVRPVLPGQGILSLVHAVLLLARSPAVVAVHLQDRLCDLRQVLQPLAAFTGEADVVLGPGASRQHPFPARFSRLCLKALGRSMARSLSGGLPRGLRVFVM